MTCTRCNGCINDLCLKKVPLFSSLTEDELMAFFECVQHLEFAKNEVVYREGEVPKGLMIVNHGCLKAFKDSYQGRRQIYYVFHEGSFFGENNLLFNQKIMYSVVASIPSKVCLIQKKDLDELLKKYPELSQKILQEVLKRLEHMELAMQSLSIKDVDGRIKAFLLEMALQSGKKTQGGLLVQLSLNRQEIADYLGIARETVSRKFGQLEDAGHIKQLDNQQILILNKAILEEV